MDAQNCQSGQFKGGVEMKRGRSKFRIWLRPRFKSPPQRLAQQKKERPVMRLKLDPSLFHFLVPVSFPSLQTARRLYLGAIEASSMGLVWTSRSQKRRLETYLRWSVTF
jgi:hypothetical protein